MKKISKEKYAKMAQKASPNSSSFQNSLFAFLFGGAICALAQLLSEIYYQLGLSLKESRTAVSITLIAMAAILTACKVYDNIAKHAGAGTLVPITGFANSVVSPAMEFRSEGLVTGVGANMFIIAGPFLVFGTLASIVYGLILYFFQLV